MNLTSVGVDDRSLEALIVSEAVVTKMPCKLIAALDSILSLPPTPMRRVRIRSERDLAAISLPLNSMRRDAATCACRLLLSSALANAAVQRLPAFWNSQINIITPLALPPQANFSCVRQCEVVLLF
jgi:hypothetical protein